MIKQTTQSQSGNVIPFISKRTPSPVLVHTGGIACKLAKLTEMLGKGGDKTHQAQILEAVSLLESAGMRFHSEQKTHLLLSLTQ